MILQYCARVFLSVFGNNKNHLVRFFCISLHIFRSVNEFMQFKTPMIAFFRTYYLRNNFLSLQLVQSLSTRTKEAKLKSQQRQHKTFSITKSVQRCQNIQQNGWMTESVHCQMQNLERQGRVQGHSINRMTGVSKTSKICEHKAITLYIP